MDVLLSWSKKLSLEAARAFHEWLPKVLPGILPWHSKSDISKGKRWFNELQSYLQSAKACIVFITSENVETGWIYWETGAIAVANHDMIYPVLVNVPTSQIEGTPLGQYQAAQATKQELLLLVESLNDHLPSPRPQLELRGAFEQHWEELERQLTRIRDQAMPPAILDTVQVLRKLKVQFGKEWPPAIAAQSSDPSSLVLDNLRGEIDQLRRNLGIREQQFCKELDDLLYTVRQRTKENRAKPAADIPAGFEKVCTLGERLIASLYRCGAFPASMLRGRIVA